MATTRPPASKSVVVETPTLGGPVLIVDADRERLERSRQYFAQSGVYAIGTSSELKALELAGAGATFRTAIVGGAGQKLDRDYFIGQLARRRPDLQVFAIEQCVGAALADLPNAQVIDSGPVRNPAPKTRVTAK